MKLPGTYRLTRYGYDSKIEKKFTPISEWYSGVIHYSPDGYMNVTVRFAEKPEALDEIVAYSGSYKVEGDRIIHQVTMSARPSYEGQTLERAFRLEGDELITEFENTDEYIKFARWTREI